MLSKQNISLTLILAIFIALLASTIFAWNITKQVVEEETRNKFQYEVTEIQNWLQNRLNLYILSIEGVHGFVEANPNVKQSEWSIYVQQSGVIEKYPGISSLSYVERVKKDNLKSFTQSVIKDNSSNLPEYKNFKVHPISDKSEYFIIKYIEPLNGREKALGFDISSEEKRLPAIAKSSRSGEISSTGKIVISTTNKPGFTIIMPVYNINKIVNNTEEERLNNLKGFISAGFRGEDMFKDVFGTKDLFHDLDFEVYDNGQFSNESLLYDYDPTQKITDLTKTPRLTAKETLRIDGQHWVISVASKDGFGLTKSQKILPTVVLISGIGFSFIFLGLFLYKFKQYH